MDPHSKTKVRYLINDVGGKTWEETSVGGEDYVGANYGWPTQEGPCRYSSKSNCPTNEDLGFVDPLFWYPHNDEDNGAAVGIAITPPGTNWPADYRNSFFVAEYNDKIVYHVSPSSNGCRDCNPPRPNYKYSRFHSYDRVVALKFGPYERNSQALYYTSRDEPVTLRRIVYKGSSDSSNIAPEADFELSASIIQVGEEVRADGSSSYDPDPNDSLTYKWNFGDGSSQKSGRVVRHTYGQAGTYEIELTVEDREGMKDRERRDITVGSPPSVRIVTPVEDATFAVGDLFTLVGEGSDSSGNPLDASALEWEVQQHHGDHFHPFFSGSGYSAEIPPAPEPEDFSAAGNSYLKVLLTGTDSIGLSTTVERNIMPKTAYVDFDTIPSNLELSLDEEIVTTPYRVLTWENHNLRVSAIDQSGYTFKSWSNGKDQSDIFKIPTGITGTDVVPAYAATFTASGGPAPGPSNQIVLVGDNGEPKSAFPLGLCEADCDNNDDCKGSLVCFKRNGVQSVPGCSGSDLFSGEDVCVLPDPGQGPFSFVGNDNRPASAFPLQACQGDCDNDGECAGTLSCFKRRTGEKVYIPGCGTVDRDDGIDFCYQADGSAPPPTPPPPPPSGGKQIYIAGDNGSPNSAFPLGLCEGDCDSDYECKGSLVCFQRDGREDVPGCLLGSQYLPGKDFCVSLGSTPVRLAGDNGRPSLAFPLKRCEGDCDNDEECEGNLECFKRSGNEDVPGCSGYLDSSTFVGEDFCVPPMWNR